jgi:hypothetical protein
VADIDAAAAAVTANGGKIVLAKCEIPTVGWLIKIKDPEGNIVCVKQPARGIPSSGGALGAVRTRNHFEPADGGVHWRRASGWLWQLTA